MAPLMTMIRCRAGLRPHWCGRPEMVVGGREGSDSHSCRCIRLLLSTGSISKGPACLMAEPPPRARRSAQHSIAVGDRGTGNRLAEPWSRSNVASSTDAAFEGLRSRGSGPWSVRISPACGAACGTVHSDYLHYEVEQSRDQVSTEQSFPSPRGPRVLAPRGGQRRMSDQVFMARVVAGCGARLPDGLISRTRGGADKEPDRPQDVCAVNAQAASAVAKRAFLAASPAGASCRHCPGGWSPIRQGYTWRTGQSRFHDLAEYLDDGLVASATELPNLIENYEAVPSVADSGDFGDRIGHVPVQRGNEPVGEYPRASTGRTPTADFTPLRKRLPTPATAVGDHRGHASSPPMHASSTSASRRAASNRGTPAHLDHPRRNVSRACRPLHCCDDQTSPTVTTSSTSCSPIRAECPDRRRHAFPNRNGGSTIGEYFTL